MCYFFFMFGQTVLSQSTFLSALRRISFNTPRSLSLFASHKACGFPSRPMTASTCEAACVSDADGQPRPAESLHSCVQDGPQASWSHLADVLYDAQGEDVKEHWRLSSSCPSGIHTIMKLSEGVDKLARASKPERDVPR